MPRRIRSSGSSTSAMAASTCSRSLPHRAIGDRQKQLLLAGEVAIQRALADVEGLGQKLGVGFRIAVLGEQGGGGIENFLSAAARRRSSWPLWISPAMVVCVMEAEA